MGSLVGVAIGGIFGVVFGLAIVRGLYRRV